jgi:hypothetical protein
MTLVQPKVEVFFDLSAVGGDFLTLDDPIKGELDDALYPLAGDIATDITSDVTYITVNRGRSRELDEINAGQVWIGLENYDGQYWPLPVISSVLTTDDPQPLTTDDDELLFDDNDELLTTGAPGILFDEDGNPLLTDGAPFGSQNIVPGKRIRVSSEGTTIFDGLIEDWGYRQTSDMRVLAEITAVDGLGQLARKDFLSWTTTAGQTAGERIVDVLDRSEVLYPANRDIGTGVATLQDDAVSYGSNVLNYLQLVAKSDLGRLFVSRTGVLTYRDRLNLVGADIAAEFTDDKESPDIDFFGIEIGYGTELLFNKVGVDREGGTLQTVNNAESQFNYGIRALTITGLLMDSDAQSLDMATYLSNIYAEPRIRVESLSIVLDAISEVERVAVLRLDLGDTIGVTWRPPGTPQDVRQLSVVEGISHRLSRNEAHVVDLRLSLSTGIESFILDSAALGVLNVNVLAF